MAYLWHIVIFITKKAPTVCHVSALKTSMWRLPESNWGHTDFQNVQALFWQVTKVTIFNCK